MAISGITTKKMKNGEEAIMVRFKYLGKIYPVKNFTKLFGCKTPIQARDKLNEVKLEISKGNDPFNAKTKDLDYYFDEMYKHNLIKKVWREDTTARNYKNYYNKYIKKDLGWKKLSKITYADLDNILRQLSHTKGTQHNMLKKIMNPIFKEALRRGEVNSNPAELLKRFKEDKKEKVTKRTMENSLSVAQKLYGAIELYKPKQTLKNELNAYLYLLVMTAHRYGELLKLTVDDIYLDKDLIISPSHITKTNEEYYFPIPSECKPYFETIKSGLLFPNLKYSSVADYFKKLLALTDIDFFKNKTLTPHDTRSLLLSVMMRDCGIDSRLADYCLEHSTNGVIAHYLDFHYEDKKEAFEKYWEKLRD
jgi:integrase